jgi:hypothetical protein
MKKNFHLSQDDHVEIRPANGCWATFYESEDFRDKSITLAGPAEYSKLNNLPGANGEDWGDQFGSLETGPNAWVIVYNDEGFSDDHYTFGPGSRIRQLAKNDDVDSLKIFDHDPHA